MFPNKPKLEEKYTIRDCSKKMQLESLFYQSASELRSNK